MMGKVHLLPGTTDASPAARGGYDSEATAVLTYPNLPAGLRSKSVNTAITSIGCWVRRQLLPGTTAWRRASLPVVPAHPEAFLISFLPVTAASPATRWPTFLNASAPDPVPDVLPVIAQPREPLVVRYDPRDISRLHVIGKDHHYHTITYANITRPPSLSRGSAPRLSPRCGHEGHKSVHEGRIFEFRAQQRELVAAATSATKSDATKDRSETLTPSINLPATTIDYGQDAVPLSG